MNFTQLKHVFSATRHEPLPHEVAGHVAEEEIQKILSGTLTSDSYLFNGRRVPVGHGQNGRYEIDLLLLTPRHLYVLEIKNYSGQLMQNSRGGWTQIKRDQSYIDHDNIVEKNQKKLNSLRAYLKKFGIDDLPDGFVQQRVLFYNPKLIVCEKIKTDPSVVTADKLYEFLTAKDLRDGIANTLFAALIRVVVAEEERQDALNAMLGHKVSLDNLAEIANAVKVLRTFDRVGLYGGRILTGDVKHLIYDGEIHNLRSIGTGVGFTCRWTRGRVLGFISAYRKVPLGFIQTQSGEKPLNPLQDKILIRSAGGEEDSEFDLSEVEWFVKG